MQCYWVSTCSLINSGIKWVNLESDNDNLLVLVIVLQVTDFSRNRRQNTAVVRSDEGSYHWPWDEEGLLRAPVRAWKCGHGPAASNACYMFLTEQFNDGPTLWKINLKNAFFGLVRVGGLARGALMRLNRVHSSIGERKVSRLSCVSAVTGCCCHRASDFTRSLVWSSRENFRDQSTLRFVSVSAGDWFIDLVHWRVWFFTGPGCDQEITLYFYTDSCMDRRKPSSLLSKHLCQVSREQCGRVADKIITSPICFFNWFDFPEGHSSN